MTAMKRSRRDSWFRRCGSASPSCSFPRSTSRGTRPIITSASFRPDRHLSVRPDAAARARHARFVAHQIKTVLNLRGSNRVDAWYRDEVAATNQRAGDPDRHRHVVLRLDVARAARRPGRNARFRRLPVADSLRVGIGTHRPGLGFRRAASPRQHARRRPRPVFTRLSVRAARRRQGHGRASRSVRKLAAFREPTNTTPANFRRWVKEGFKPGVPNREQWPYDPYPLVVITARAGPKVASSE